MDLTKVRVPEGHEIVVDRPFDKHVRGDVLKECERWRLDQNFVGFRQKENKVVSTTDTKKEVVRDKMHDKPTTALGEQDNNGSKLQ